jgi:adenylylsulfate kinase
MLNSPMSQPKSKNISWHGSSVTREERYSLQQQRGAVVWFTGLSGAGKSTLARRVEQLLLERDTVAYTLDGDNLRFSLNKDLGFSPEDRSENIRRVGCVAELFADSGTICLTAFISPYRGGRDAIRKQVGDAFIEVHVSTPIEECERRDPKGLYAKARAGEIESFTGLTAPYEAPESPEMVIDTTAPSVEACAEQVVAYLEERGFLRGVSRQG